MENNFKNIYPISQKFYKCLTAALHMNENLMPVDCIQILEKEYGKRINYFKDETLRGMLYRMMQQAVDRPDKEAIIETVEYFLS